MTLSGELRVLFRAAAGPRMGFGHLIRCLSLSRALGARPLIAVRGGEGAADAALALGGDVIRDASPRIIAALRADVVVIDDPIEREARLWVDAARAAGAVVVTMHDLGIGCTDGDLVIDGSVTRTARAARHGRAAVGPRFAVLHPSLVDHRRRAGRRHPQMLIALGGGPRVRTAAAIARAVTAAHPTVHVRIAGGFAAGHLPSLPRVTWIDARAGLAPELARADVAVVGGGMSLYEACAVGVPAVGVPVVRAQLPTVRGFARRGAALGVGFPASPVNTAAQAMALLANDMLRRALARRSRRIVDGRGAARVAAAVTALAERKCA